MEKLKDLIKGPDLIVAPVALNPIMAQMAALAGFKAAYLSGGSLGWYKGVTEAGLSLTEMIQVVVDIRTVGITAGIDLSPNKEGPGKRGFDCLNVAFHDNDLMVRIAGDTIALTPPLIVSEDQIGEIIGKVAKVIRAVA